MSRCPNIDASLLEKTKIDKLLPRILKRGDERVKEFTQRILENAKRADKKSASVNQVNGRTKKVGLDTKQAVSKDIKKEGHDPSRKSSLDAASKDADVSTTAKPRSFSNDVKAGPKAKSDISTDTKTKVVNVTAKPSGFFSSLKSASKRPGTSNKFDDGNSRYATIHAIIRNTIDHRL